MLQRFQNPLTSLAVVALFAVPALAAPTTISDNTAGTATVDGTINSGEYVGFSEGVGTGFGDVIGTSSQLYVDSDDSGNLNFGLSRGSGDLNDAVVIYIDAVPGGFATTATFDDNADPLRSAVSGFSGGGDRSTLEFPTGFEADFAIAFDTTFAGLWSLAGTGSHPFLANAGLVPTGDVSASDFEFAVQLSDLGLAPGGSFDYVVTYLNPGNVFRSNEFHGVTTAPAGNVGQATYTFADGDFNTFTAYEPPVDTDDDSWGAVKSMYDN
jgi:hypothetical protein